MLEQMRPTRVHLCAEGLHHHYFRVSTYLSVVGGGERGATAQGATAGTRVMLLGGWRPGQAACGNGYLANSAGRGGRSSQVGVQFTPRAGRHRILI